MKGTELMPNIEIQGFTNPHHTELDRLEIVRLLKQDKDHKSIVVTVCPTVCTDLEGEERPFLRIYAKDPNDAYRIAKILNQDRKLAVETCKIIEFLEPEK
jgi:hypothetical protein